MKLFASKRLTFFRTCDKLLQRAKSAALHPKENNHNTIHACIVKCEQIKTTICCFYAANSTKQGAEGASL